MKLKIVHPSFEINLIDNSFSMVEENFWFSDETFAKYTYPISKKFNAEEEAAFNFITELTATGYNTVFDVKFYAKNKEHDAVLEIELIVGRKVEFQIRYGFEDFPNFDKKLSELPLHEFKLTGEDIFAHAATLIDKEYPDTDYNFPSVFIDLDTDSAQWESFEGRMNNWDGTKFKENEYDTFENLQKNYNVMQPLPHLLYVFRAGFAEKGYSLSGDILDDPEFSKAYIAMKSEYYTTIADLENEEMRMLYNEYHDQNADGHYLFEKSIFLTEPGRYRISGNLNLNPGGNAPRPFQAALAVLEISNNQIGEWVAVAGEKYFYIDIVVVLRGTGPFELTFKALANNHRVIGGTKVFDADLVDISAALLNKYDGNGNPIPTLIKADEINLKQCVPDITFGDMWRAIRTWKNYDITIKDDEVQINLVKNQMGNGTVKNLSHKEAPEPERQFNQGRSFEFKFTEFEHEDYKYTSYFIDRNGVKQQPYVNKEDTEEIVIDALPLPLKSEDNAVTAHDFLNDQSRLQLVLYSGLTGGMNFTEDPENLLIPSLYANHYQEWFEFLLKTVLWKWLFHDYMINLSDLHNKSTVFAYGRNHVVKGFSQRNMGDDILETEIETYSLE